MSRYDKARVPANSSHVWEVSDDQTFHQISAETVNSESPGSGDTVVVTFKPPGLNKFQQLGGGSINMASPTPIIWQGYGREIKVTNNASFPVDVSLLNENFSRF